MTIEQAIEQAAKELPEEWAIEIVIENREVVIVLIDEEGFDVPLPHKPGDTLNDRIATALAVAERKAGEQ